MVLTITTTHKPATDLGFLLHKNPSRLHTSELPFGKAYVFYNEATEEQCSATLMLEVDAIGLVRNRRAGAEDGGLFGQYVNDRPYVASSFMSTALTDLFSTAMGGRSKERQELADSDIPLEVHIPVLPCRGGEVFLRSLFEPLGYEVDAVKLGLQEKFPEWGESRYLAVTLRKNGRLKDLLNHLYVLIPVLDDEKHYFVGREEIEKLLRRGEEWLKTHPKMEEITNRYLRRQKQLTREALARLSEEEGIADPDEVEAEHASEEEALEKKLSLHDQRLNAVATVLKDSGAHRVVDLGCGEGKLLRLLIKEKQFTEICGMDVSLSILERAEKRLRFDQMSPRMKERVRLIHGSLMYRDKRIEGFDGAAVVEVIEHLDEPRLAAFERIVFEFAKPKLAVVTTPNAEYNVLFQSMPAGSMRHKDHRFEWTRAQFADWAARVSETHGYKVAISGIGPEDEQLGAPSQMAVFTQS